MEELMDILQEFEPGVDFEHCTDLIDGKILNSLEILSLVAEIEDMFDIKFDCEDIDTINGYLIYKMGKIPQENEEFETVCDGYRFKVLKVSNKMITDIEVTPENADEVKGQ